MTEIERLESQLANAKERIAELQATVLELNLEINRLLMEYIKPWPVSS